MKIRFYCEDIPEIKINKNQAIRFIEQLIEDENRKTGTISIIFCSDEYLLKVNKQYLKHDFYTDVITFDYSELNVVSGDIFISIERIRENAEQFRESFNRELFRVIFHGFLHLIGYNDKTIEEKRMMQKKENFYLDKFKYNN